MGDWNESDNMIVPTAEVLARLSYLQEQLDTLTRLYSELVTETNGLREEVDRLNEAVDGGGGLKDEVNSMRDDLDLLQDDVDDLREPQS